MTMGSGSLWVLDQPFQRAGSKAQPDALLRVNPVTGHVIATITVGRGGISTVFGAGSVWVANTEDASISRIDPSTNAVTATITVAKGPETVLSGFGSIWVESDFGNVTLTRIDPATDRTAKTFPGLVSPSFGPKVIWVVGPGAIHGVVERLDPSTNALIPGGYSPDVGPAVPVAWGNAVWVGKWYPTPGPACPPESSCIPNDTFEYRRYDPVSRTLAGPGFPAYGPIEISVGYGDFWMRAGHDIQWAPISQPA
jgi:YVTN family beta-propeller protein